MKQLWFAMSLVTGSLLFSANASATPASGALLQQMNLASQSLNYELSFISINKQGVESLRYRHARLDNRPLAQLLQMDGPRREVVQRGNEISYFEPGLEPFTLNGDYIVDSLPSLIYPISNAFLLTTTLSPSGARVLLIVFAKSFAWLPEMVHATATSCGWTPNRNYRCGLISLIAMVKRWNNFA